VRAVLAVRLGAAAGVGVGTAAGLFATAKAAAGVGVVGSTGGAPAVVAGGALATKLVGVALVLTATVGAGAAVKLARRSAHAPVAVRTSSEIHDRRTVAAAPRELSPPPSPHTTAVDPTPSDEAPSLAKLDARDLAGTGPRRHPAPAAGASSQACVSAPSGADIAARRPESAVADEARLVHDGVRALRAGQPACALSLLDTHARFYPEGVLADERDAERALALADLGQAAEARAAAELFLRKHPASPLGVRLRRRIPGIDVADGEPIETTRARPPR
jgi:hypothetical protein